MCEIPSWGRISAPAGVAPEALEEWLHSSKGYERRPSWLLDWGDCPVSFSAGFGIPFSNSAGACERGRLVEHMELHNRRLPIHSRVRPEPRRARSPRALACVKKFRRPSTFITTSSPFRREKG